MRYAIANWKMNVPPEGIDKYVEACAAAEPAAAELIIAPPFPFIAELRSFAGDRRIGVSAQNCSDQISGAFTGEVAAAMIRRAGAESVIIGHSERRKIYGESNKTIGAKLVRATEVGLLPVFCIGEELEIRESGGTDQLLERQIGEALEIASGAGEMVVAYEPVWAIGTGRVASTEIVAETHARIREILRRSGQPEAPIVYGGSVTPENARELARQPEVAGFLVGGASLSSAKMLQIRDALAV
jgi:triosephosphate isomerase (TIM)